MADFWYGNYAEEVVPLSRPLPKYGDGRRPVRHSNTLVQPGCGITKQSVQAYAKQYVYRGSSNPAAAAILAKLEELGIK